MDKAEVKLLQAIYSEKEAAWSELVDAYDAAMDAANRIKAMCDEAYAEKEKAGKRLLEVVREGN